MYVPIVPPQVNYSQNQQNNATEFQFGANVVVHPFAILLAMICWVLSIVAIVETIINGTAVTTSLLILAWEYLSYSYC